MSTSRFVVLLGPDRAGKSSALTRVARESGWRVLSTDTAYLEPEHALIGQLRRHLFDDVMPRLGKSYSTDFMAGLLQTAVIYLRDRLLEQNPETPVLMDSYYYKIIAKCRLAGVNLRELYSWWRSFPQPNQVVYLDVSPGSAWRRSGYGARLNPLEYFGDRPGWFGFESYQTSLRKLLLEETRHLPVTMLPEQGSEELTAGALMKVLAA